MEEEEQRVNPWAVKTVEEFRLYCCPECNHKCRESNEFQSHASLQHPLSAILFEQEQNAKLNIDDQDLKTDPSWHPETEIKEEEEEDVVYEDHENFYDNDLDFDYDEEDVDFEVKPLKRKSRTTKVKRKTKRSSRVKISDSGAEDDKDHDENEERENDANYERLFNLGSNTLTVVNTEGETVSIEKQTFGCPKCDMSSWSYLILCRHMHSQHRRSDGMYECPACSNLFNSLAETRSHIKSNHKLPCPVCHKQVSDLSGHFTRTHPADRDMKKFKCLECDFATHRNSLLSQHVFVNHRKDEHKYKCDECDKKFPTKFLLNQHHEVKHTDPEGIARRYVCDKCGKAFAYKNAVSNHACHSKESLKVNCDKCGDEFPSESYYIWHYQSQHGDYPSHLKHKLTHLCDQCPKAFTKKASLQQHKKIKHLNIKKKTSAENSGPFPCSKCSKIFANKSTLKRHDLVVHQQNPEQSFQCDKCDKKCASKALLRMHVKNVHHREQCPECGMKITTLYWLRRHLSVTHGIQGEGMQCANCPKMFVNKTSLEKHMQSCQPKV